ncbi:LA_2272 family surface repeat-containing protein [Chryseobacterium sp. JUb7]|uniref:LA_2272 family surface repeat-containing protein n=1 Tax=Chryseobacterium sp. JUb7 TaxID=2940599 RepID=UPI002168BDB3|nr:hypothetical protein [Chryseobacterium sp. JUb7]MCS3531429.1 hypothetical protein [Chryseobacterium sp. JUb7]
MRTRILLILSFLIVNFFHAQDSLKIQKAKLIALTPFNDNIDKVNGLTVGLGFDSKYVFKEQNVKLLQKVNGLNLDVNALGFLFWMFYDPAKGQNIEFIKVNGITISAAGYLRGVSHNGINLSLYNYGHTMNGVSGTLFTTYIEEGNGIFVSPVGFYSKELNGVSISVFNDAEIMKGIQIGGYNSSEVVTGMQIGLVNKSKKLKGLQIGLWNKNGKRSLPIINF